MPFANRIEAGRQLAAALGKYRKDRPVVLALPRGGVPVAAEVATALEAPLGLLLVRKIGVPFQPELAMGAVVDGDAPSITRNEDVIAASGVGEEDFDAACRRELKEIERRRAVYLGGRPPLDIAKRTAIVIDDGIATGATVRAALRSAKGRHPARLILAVPVAAADTLARLRREVDDIVCLEAPDDLGAIGAYYVYFNQVADGEVIDLLDRAEARFEKSRPSAAGAGGAP